MTDIYPVENNWFYLTLIDEDYKLIRCKKDYQGKFAPDSTYRYKLSRHNETGIDVYVVYTNNYESDLPSYFTKKNLADYFDLTAIFREEKLNSLGI
jgi:hypothetical protein